MADVLKTMKLHIYPDKAESEQLQVLTKRYAEACTAVSGYVFGHGFILNFMKLQDAMYQTVRSEFGLKSQFTISVFKSVTARYKTLQEQMQQRPYKYEDESGAWQYIPRTLEWLMKPVVFSRPQADFVRGRDYSFVQDKRTGENLLSMNTLTGRIRVRYDVPEYFNQYFDGTWTFGTGKAVMLNGEWYFHIPMSKTIPDTFDAKHPSHVVGIDRGLRFLAVTYDESGRTLFIDGRRILDKRDRFQQVRSECQSKGTRSAKRVLKRVSGRENRWMSDVNHQISKTLVQKYGTGTLFVIEDLKNVSFDDNNLSGRSRKQRRNLRTWTFYQLEQYLTYKAHASGSEVLKVPADYTSQRCPKCGRILKANRHHDTHEYVCDCCGYRSNDDRVGAMNIQMLGTMYVSGDMHPRYGVRKVN